MDPKNKGNEKARGKAVEEPREFRVLWVGPDEKVKRESTDFTEVLIIWPDARAGDDDAQSTN